MQLKEEEYLAHYGILRKSGRYPWGSGGTQTQRNKMYLDTISDLRKQGMSDPDIAASFSRPDRKFTTTDLRALTSIAKNEQRQQSINQAQRLQDKGYSNVAIGDRMNINESSVRSLLAPGAKDKADVLKATADMLKREVDEKGAIDIGTQSHQDLPLSDNSGARIGITSTKFNTAVARLKEEGYVVHKVKVKTLNVGNMTEIKVLARPDVEWKNLVKNPDQIKLISKHTEDGGKKWEEPPTPKNFSSKKIEINYKEGGGDKKDGLIELRPGVKDLDLGTSRYAQVRIAVDGTHYLKGMAVYNDKLPAGTDIRFNTNKSSKDTDKLGAMKEMEKDKLTGKTNIKEPFGAQITRAKGVLNIVNEEGKWDTWAKNLPSQMLSKQDPKLAKTQLDLTYDRRKLELNSLLQLSNPTVRKHLLEKFADETDSAATHLRAAARPKQATKVLIPVNSVKPNEIYAPSHRDGERVALVRFPHGGTFEIPEVTVNNRNPEARRILGSSAKDAVGINHKVAERLSGADFDGDTVLVIPNSRGEVKSTPALTGLKDFDPKVSYKAYEGMKKISEPHMQRQMGEISNLITDMTIRGANDSEKARAVRHSMVVIDSHKHNLDFKSSARDNGIKDLKHKYQSNDDGTSGASTLLSRATATKYITKRKPRPAKDGGPIDKATGKKVYVDDKQTYTDKKGKVQERNDQVDRLSVTDDAHSLSSGTRIERVYADHSNRLKAMGNQARKEMVNTQTNPQNKSAKITYKKDVETLNAKLRVAQKNAPLERQAQAIGRTVVSQKRAANPTMTNEQIKKVEQNALKEARFRTGADKHQVKPTQSEWDAIQAGAISDHKLKQILTNGDLEVIRTHATPRAKRAITSAKSARAKAMLSQGYTQAEVADALGVALSTLKISLAD